jgi:threonine dehydrogenase-like Zn-dependent dehydrogenase
MKALCWHGTGDVRIDTVPDPKIEHPRDAIVKITASGICGSDLHLLNGFVPTMQAGDILGHEPMGEVVELGKDVYNLRVGDRVVVPFTIACGSCYFCNKTLFSLCDNSNRNAEMARKQMGHSPSGLFGFSHMLGGFPGGQAEYLRVPFADVGPIKIESGLPDESVLFLSDIFPTGYMAAENCGMDPGDTVAVWGCGPVGQFAIKSAWMLGAGRVIAIDSVAERLKMAEEHGRAEIINYEDVDVYERLMELTTGRGPDRCIDAVGCEAHAANMVAAAVDTAKEAVMLRGDRTYVLQQAIRSCRKGGTISVPGAYLGAADPLPMGAFMNKGLTMTTGQTHMQRYLKPLLQRIESGEIDPSFVITHRVPLTDAPEAYKTFRDKQDGCIKVVLKP